MYLPALTFRNLQATLGRDPNFGDADRVPINLNRQGYFKVQDHFLLILQIFCGFLYIVHNITSGN